MLRLQLLTTGPVEDTYLLASAEHAVRVNEGIRKCVAFAAFDAGAGRRLCGTVFVVGLPVSENRSARFVVTAAHILDEVEKSSADGRLHIRFNRRGGGFVWVETDLAAWVRHPSDPSVDCAAIPMPLPTDADVLAFTFKSGEDSWLTEDAIAKLGVGVGDEVFFPGLFIKHAGEDQNAPIVRTGVISAMATAGVSGGRGPMKAYLVEARSVGGLSGSPVFVQIPRNEQWKRSGGSVERVIPHAFFMGLIHGHWDVRPAPDGVLTAGLTESTINMGIAIVVPAQYVWEVLRHPEIEGVVHRLASEDRKAAEATMDGATDDLGI